MNDMCVIEIVNKRTLERVGPAIFVGRDRKFQSITEGMIAAQSWLLEKKSRPGEYRIVPRPM